MDGGPSVDVTLRELAGEPDLAVRTAAYEALARRATRAQAQRLAAALEREPGRGKVGASRLETLAAERFPGGTVQGVSRVQVEDKFLLDVVPFGEPLVYVTQQGRPRVVLFGADQMVRRPALASAWGDRFLMRAEPSGPVRVQYRAAGRDRAVRLEAPGSLPEFVRFLAHETTPERPEGGLDMTYSDVVGVLSALCASGSVGAPFATEQDRLKAQLLSAAASREGADRPEKAGDEPVVVQVPAVLQTGREPTAEKPAIVPIGPAPTKN
jgi:hypothetical protein